MTMTKDEWLIKGRELNKTKTSYQWEIGSWVNEGLKQWGEDYTLKAISVITHNKKIFYLTCARTAAIYKPELRFSDICFSTYVLLRSFNRGDFLEKFLPTVRGLSVSRTLALAVEKYGSDPRPKHNTKTRRIVRLSERAWSAAVEAAKAGGHRYNVQTWVEKVILAAIAAKETKKDAIGSSEAAGKSSGDSQTRPARRELHKQADELLKKQTKKRCTCGIRPAWTPCLPTTADIKPRFKPTCLASRTEAEIANEKYFACHGFREMIVECATCGRFHLRHVYASEVQHGTAQAQA